jgi:hypothetical protein
LARPVFQHIRRSEVQRSVEWRRGAGRGLLQAQNLPFEADEKALVRRIWLRMGRAEKVKHLSRDLINVSAADVFLSCGAQLRTSFRQNYNLSENIWLG